MLRLNSLNWAALALLFGALVFLSDRSIAAEDAAEPAKERFSILEYRVLGNSVLQPADIESKLYPLLGEGKTIDDVEVARKTLEALYRDLGFGTVFVDIPEQDVDQGVVRLQVTQGRLDRVRITGARYFSNRRIRESLPVLEKDSVVELPKLQAQLSQVNQQARDRQVTPVLRAGRIPGTVDIDLKVKDSLPLHGGVELNDRYSANTSETRASVNVSYDNLFQRYQTIGLQLQTTPEDTDQVQVIALSYLLPLVQSGNLFAFYAVDTNSDFAAVSDGGGSLSILGAGRIYGARFVVRLPSSQSFYQSFTTGVDFKDFTDNIKLPDSVIDSTPIKYMTWTASYGGGMNSESSSTTFNLGANFGIRGLANDPDEFEYKRYKAKANFFYLRGDGSYEKQLWKRSAAFVRFTGQYSTEPLISNEQFAMGGAETVRGYLESQTIGDYGIAGSFELRSPSMHAHMDKYLQKLFGFFFYDAGVVSSIELLPGQSDMRRISLQSTGLGIRLSAFNGLDAALDWAYPLRAIEDITVGDSRVHFQVRYSF